MKTLTHLWRIEFDTDLTHAGAPILPLGLMIEAAWPSRARGLGMLFRRRLNPLELDRVNGQTWPELGDMETFMRSLFDEAWKAEDGGREVALRFPARSSLHFSEVECEVDLGAFDRVHSVPRMLECLLQYGETWLVPAIKAPVVKLPERRRPAAQAAPDLHTMAEAA
jgi:hypothetical protein